MSDLGTLIDTLSRMPMSAPLKLAPMRFAGELSSYRGYYDHLAIESSDKPITVREFLKIAEAADGETFTGYKGGDYTMGLSTPVWVSDYGDASGRRFTGIAFDGNSVLILTEDEGW